MTEEDLVTRPLVPASTRRGFFATLGTGALAAAGCAAQRSTPAGERESKAEPAGEAEVSPPEDLMREHGVLKRVILVYDETIRRIDGGIEVPAPPLADALAIIRAFVEDYHEKLEEDFLFPRFRKANTLVDLVDVLQQQHQAGRRVTDVAMRYASAASLKSADDRAKLADALRQFVRMYEPHEAREDTVLFPALRRVIPASEWDALGEDFEREEDRRFGEDGFETIVERVAKIEREFGIYDLAQFTPRA
jgi:hemerythrin-like domain-containing protein